MNERERIGTGRTADIYTWEDGKVIKLFRLDFQEEWIANEEKVTRLAHQAGLAAPETYGRQSVDGKAGIIYERIIGRSMLQCLSDKPWNMVDLTRTFAEVQAKMHQTSAGEFPSQRERLERNIRNAAQLTTETKDQVAALLHSLPDGEFVCHGDYHPENLVLTDTGPVVIDWMTAVRGNPIADVARTSLLFGTPFWLHDEHGLKKTLLHLGRSAMHHQYLREYRKLRPVSTEEIRAWIPVLAAARLVEQVPAEEDWLLGMVDRAVGNL